MWINLEDSAKFFTFILNKPVNEDLNAWLVFLGSYQLICLIVTPNRIRKILECQIIYFSILKHWFIFLAIFI